MENGFFYKYRFEIMGILLLALLSAAVQHGRIAISFNGTSLSSDPAQIAVLAAAKDNPQAFAKDLTYSNPDYYDTYSTIHLPLIRFFTEDGHYGLGYLKLTGIHIFLHYLGFYLLGLKLTQKRGLALVFSILMGQCYWILWGTYWGAGYPDYTPRTTFSALFGFYACVALSILQKPRLWPVFMAATGLLIYVHSISTLPMALGFWLGFLICRPAGASWPRHLVWMIFCGLCFLVAAGPFAAHYLKPGVSLGPDDAAFMRHILRVRFDIEFTEYFKGIAKFVLHYTVLPVFPLAIFSAVIIKRFGGEREKALLRQLGMWTIGTLCIGVVMFTADQEISRMLNRHHFEFDLIRTLRFLVFLSISAIFLASTPFMGLAVKKGQKYYRGAKIIFALVCIGFFIGGSQDLIRNSLFYYWNNIDKERFSSVYASNINRAQMIEAVKKFTEPGAAILALGEEQAIRYDAQRSLIYCRKDPGVLYYAKAVNQLKLWDNIRMCLDESPTSYINCAIKYNAEYIISNRPQDLTMLQEFGSVLWTNGIYTLVKKQP